MAITRPPPSPAPRRRARVAALAVAWLALTGPAHAEGVPDDFAFDPPAGWAVDPAYRDQLRDVPSVRATFGYGGNQELFGVMQVVLTEPAAGTVRAQIDAFHAGLIDGVSRQATVGAPAHTETDTTMDVSFAAVQGGVALQHRCTTWVGRDRAVHAACGMCVAQGTTSPTCEAALRSIQITAPAAARLSLSSTARAGRSAAFEAGRRVGQVALPLGAIALALYFLLRKR